MISVKVPATSANIGPGFDCVGLALQIYNTIEVEEISQGLEINILDETEKFLPRDEKNLVFRSMMKVFQKVGHYPRGLKINLTNNIPVTRGLGSSSACVAGGLCAANAIIGNPLSQQELIEMAVQIEGHPDNVTPAIVGGAVVALFSENGVRYIRKPLPNTLKFAVFVPGFMLSTRKARRILPKYVTHQDAAYNTARVALLAASLMTEDYSYITDALDDRLHQPYRAKLIPGFKKIFKISKQNGAKGVYLSGAGPTIIAMIDRNDADFEQIVNQYLKWHMRDWQLKIVGADNEGIKIVKV